MAAEEKKNKLDDPEWWFDDGWLEDPNSELCPFAQDYVNKVKRELEETSSR